jgi:serine/threonine-protein kinase
MDREPTRSSGLRRCAAAALIITSVLIGTTTRARAQAHPQAEQLFRDGKALMKAGRLAEACDAFESSERAEHNVATLMNAADCREKNQQYASAWAQFLQADSGTRGDPTKAALNTTAKKRIAALEPRLSYLTINVPDESRVEGLEVTRDGALVDPVEWNRSIPVDGGSHVIAGKAPGHESWSTTLEVAAEHDKQAVEVPKFKELPKIINHEVDQGRPFVVAPVAPPAPSPFTPRRKIALGVAGGGVALAIVATGFGLSARSLRSDALATCPPGACVAPNDAAANAINDRARSRALIANIGFGVAGAAVVAGAVLWFTGAPTESATATSALRIVPTLGASPGFAVLGSF